MSETGHAQLQLFLGLLISFLAAFFGGAYADQLAVGFCGVAITLIWMHWTAVRRAGRTISEAVGTVDRLMADSELWGVFLDLAKEALKVREVPPSLVHDSQQEALMHHLVICRDKLAHLTSGRFDHDESGRIRAMIRAFGEANSIQAISDGNFPSWWSQGIVAKDYTRANLHAIERGATVDRIFIVSSAGHLEQARETLTAQIGAGVTVWVLRSSEVQSIEIAAILEKGSNFAVFDDELVSVETYEGQRPKGFLSIRPAEVVDYRERWDMLRANSKRIASAAELEEFLSACREREMAEASTGVAAL